MDKQNILFFILLLNVWSCTNESKRPFTKMEKLDISSLGMISSMLDEDKFWTIVQNSLDNTANQDQQYDYLVHQVSKLSPTEMIGFRLRTDKLLYDTYTSEMWCAGYLINGGCSDDGFEYFRNWVISRGKEVFYKAKDTPDSLSSEVGADTYDYEFEMFWYVALKAFENKTGKNLYDYIDYEKFTTREGNYPHFEFNWQENKPETLKAICPQLFEKFGW